jgi:uncharacterized membrane protein
MRLIGFVTGQFADPKSGVNMSCVFMPGALSPMTGLLIVTETAKLVDAPLSIEEAMKMIFSGGLIGPGADKKGKPSRSKTPANVALPVASADFAHLPTAEDQPEAPGGVAEPVVRG